MGNTIFISDLSICEPKSALCPEARKGRWSVWDYETHEHKGTKLKGKMLYANSQTEPPPVTLRLGVSGWHAVYLGFYYADDPRAHTVRVKLTGDQTFARVQAEPTSPKDGNHAEQNINFSLLAETLWRTAELTGKDLIISGRNPKGSAAKDGCSSLAYVKLVPLSEEDLGRLQRLGPRQETRRLIAVTDGATAGVWWPESKEDLWEDIDPMAGTDVEIVLCTMARYDITYYPSRVGEMRSVKRGFYHYVMQAAVLAEMRRKGLDMLRTYIDRVHDHGLKFYATNRPAGPHPPPNHLTGEGPLYREHPEFRCVTQDGQPAPHLSFAFPEVRQRLIDVLREQAEAGADGVSIMFNRSHPWVLFEDPAWRPFAEKHGADRSRLDPTDEGWCRHKAGYLTALMRGLRGAIDEVGRTQGRRIGIGHMVMGAGRSRLYFGIDVETWMREGLVDFLIIHPYSYHVRPYPGEDESIEGGIRELRPLANQTGVKLYADVYPRRMPGYVYLNRAKDYYGAGADGLAYWDVESRIYRKSEWFTSSRLGHVDLLDEWPLDLQAHFDRIPLKSVAGMVTDRRYSGHTNG